MHPEKKYLPNRGDWYIIIPSQRKREYIMTCRLIAFDLDGTLLDNKKRISPENLRALCAAAEHGAVIVPATGRILRAIPPELRELPFIRYYILSNGAAVYDTVEERTISRGDIPLALALRVMEFLDTQPVLYDCYQNEIGLMTKSMYEQTPEFFREEPEILKLVLSLRTPVPDLKETLRDRGEDIQKLQFFYRPEDNEERLRMIARFPTLFPELSATTSTSNNVEVKARFYSGLPYSKAGKLEDSGFLQDPYYESIVGGVEVDLDALHDALQALMSMNYAEFYPGTDAERRLKYRTAWSIAKFLEAGAPKVRFNPFKNYKKDYVRILIERRDPTRATFEVFGSEENFKKFAAEWKKYWEER